MKINCKKLKRKSSLKKFFISSFAIASLAATITAPNLNTVKVNSLSANSLKSSRNDTNTSPFVFPKANDIYDDYSYANGFVTIDGSVINFIDWFGLKSWSFDVNTNLINLFGDASSNVSTLKVRSSPDGTQIFVYGYLMNGSSYIFRLNTDDGSISLIGNKKAYTTKDGLIQKGNLLTIIDGCAILTPKTPDNSLSTITFSQIDLTNGTLGNNIQYNISSLKAQFSVYRWDQIIGVFKTGSMYLFDILTLTSGGNYYSPSVVFAYITGGNALSISTSYTYWSLTADSNLNLDNAICCVQNMVWNDGSVSVYVVPKYDTTSTTLGYPVSGSGNVNYYNQNIIIEVTLKNYTISTNTFLCRVKGSTDGIAGVTNFLVDKNTNRIYAVLVNANSSSKIAIAPIYDFSNSGWGTAPGWIDLGSSGINITPYQIFNLGFIPNMSNETNLNGGYVGYIEIQHQNDLNNLDQSTFNETKTFFELNTSGTSLTTLSSPNFSFAVSDSEINSKYVVGKYEANQSTENELVNDLILINQSGNPYNIDSYTNNISISNQSLVGNVTIYLNNWWNNGKTKIIRNVDINLGNSSGGNSNNSNAGNPGNNSGSSGNNFDNNPGTNSVAHNTSTDNSMVIIYPIVVIVVLFGIAIALILIKHMQKVKYLYWHNKGLGLVVVKSIQNKNNKSKK